MTPLRLSAVVLLVFGTSSTALAVPGVSCTITAVKYPSGTGMTTVEVVDGGVSLPAAAANNPIEIWGTFGPTNANATVSGYIVDYDPITEQESNRRNLSITKIRNAQGSETGEWKSAGVTVQRGKVYRIYAATTSGATTVNADPVTLNVSNN